jgi:OOP family OmpA-OmpF porin
MITLKDMPEEIQASVSYSTLLHVNSIDGDEPAIYAALKQLSEIVLNAFAETVSQLSGREVIWKLAREAVTIKNAGQQGAEIVRTVLDDRYHGTIHGIASKTQLSVSTVGSLLEVGAAAALSIMGRLVAEYSWSAQELAQWLRPYHADSSAAKIITEVATPVVTRPNRVPGWLATRSNVLLLVVSLIAIAEGGYIVGTHITSREAIPSTTMVPAPSDGQAAPAASHQYAALPVVNRTPTTVELGRGRTSIPVVLKLKDGLRQVIGASSTESKLYQFLIDPSTEVDLVDPTKDWIGFDRIYFETNKAMLTNESLWQLSNVASILKRFPTAQIKIGGYTDSSGNPISNLRLSRERATATKEALVSMGVPAARLTAVGFGALDNIASNDTEEGRSLNRRVNMQITHK